MVRLSWLGGEARKRERERRWERGGGGEREGRRGDVGEKERVGEGRWKIGSGREGGKKDWRSQRCFERKILDEMISILRWVGGVSKKQWEGMVDQIIAYSL